MSTAKSVKTLALISQRFERRVKILAKIKTSPQTTRNIQTPAARRNRLNEKTETYSQSRHPAETTRKTF